MPIASDALAPCASATPAVTAPDAAAERRRRTTWARLKHRLSGPGGIYTLGNLLGLAVGLSVAAYRHRDAATDPGTVGAMWGYLGGSPAALLMTLATLIFFASGEAYHRARTRPSGPALAIPAGDFLSGCGALALAGGLFVIGDPLLASTSGLLHAGGKFGSAAMGFGGTDRVARFDLACRLSVLFSRAPAVALALLALWRGEGAAWADAAVPATLIACTALWGSADLMLLASARSRH